MSEQKFTPGPWFIDETKGPWILGKTAQATIGIWAQKRFDDALAVNDHDVDPEDEKWLCGAWGKCSPEDFANAHLIATAPDMYEALKDITSLCDYLAEEIFSLTKHIDGAKELRKSIKERTKHARAALAKAEGKT